MTSILIFLVVLSVLVFVHELGHFVAAKACNIYVDQFSIGMPPRLFGFKWGDTDYCISALPLGGYVKMAGQEDAPLSDEEREATYGHVPSEQWFCNRPVWQRLIVLFAGPFMNLVLAVVVFAFMAIVGDHVPSSSLEARIGYIDEDYPAKTAALFAMEKDGALPDLTGTPDATGLTTGDLIVSMNGEPVDNIQNVIMNTVLVDESTSHTFVIQRTAHDGTQQYFATAIVPKKVEGEDDFARFGFSPFQALHLTKIYPGEAAEQAGLQEDDIITHVDGVAVDMATLTKQIESVPEGQEITLTIKRPTSDLEKLSALAELDTYDTVEISLSPRGIGRFQGLNWEPSPEYLKSQDLSEEGTEINIFYVSDEMAGATGLQAKDVITAINGEPATPSLLRELEQNKAGEDLTLTIERPSILFGLGQKAETLEVDVPVSPVRWMGVQLGMLEVFHSTNFASAIPSAFIQCYDAVAFTLETISALITGNVSPKNIGGPVMIFDVTSKAAEAGWYSLLRIMAIISINLAVFNLLPLPVLDGGQIVINSLEAVRRKPLSMKFQERFQTVGVIMIIGLMLFVTFNDVGRMIRDMLP